MSCARTLCAGARFKETRVNILFIGDVVGKPGREAMRALLPGILAEYKADAVIVNGENSASGFGITQKIADEMFSQGVLAITSGNHIWDRKESMPFIAKEHRVLRPLNYPPGVPGTGSVIVNVDGIKLAVISLMGRIFMSTIDCPFRAADEEVQRLSAITNNIFIDIHAEATSEKIALAHYLDGRVSAVIGTHTHVQTADERVLCGGTAYITDAGMTGPIDSIIGVRKTEVIERFLTSMPQKFEVPDGPVLLCGVVVDIDSDTGRAVSIKRIQRAYPPDVPSTAE